MTKETGKWLDEAGPRTRAVRSGIRRTPEGEHAEPIFTSSSFLFDSPEDAAAKFAGEVDGNVYSRYTNPTVRAFEERMARVRGPASSSHLPVSFVMIQLSLCRPTMAPSLVPRKGPRPLAPSARAASIDCKY